MAEHLRQGAAQAWPCQSIGGIVVADRFRFQKAEKTAECGRFPGEAGRGKVRPALGERRKRRPIGLAEIAELRSRVGQVVAISEQGIARCATFCGEHGKRAVNQSCIARTDGGMFRRLAAHQIRAMASAAIMRA